jgi:predicted secreted protein
MMKLQHVAGAFLCLVAAVLVAAKVDNIIHEVRFAEVYRHWSASETEKSIYVNAGDMILVRMNENPGTGYRWQLVTDEKDGFDQTLCQLQPTSGFAEGLYEPSTSTDGSDDKVVDGVSRPYVPPGAGEWPYPYPWGDRRFDIRCTKAGSTVLKLRYKRSWEERYSWESRLNVYVLANN